MTEKIYNTPNGDIHYWVGGRADGKANLVFLPGLTADHRQSPILRPKTALSRKRNAHLT